MLDVDQHLFETRTTWRDYIDPSLRDRAIVIEDDALGYPWLVWNGRRLYLAEMQFPGKANLIGDMRLRLKRGEPAERRYDDELPLEYTDPKARVKKLDEWGVESAALLPNFGLLWEDMLAEDPEAVCGNMRAYNRWMAELVAEGGGRLHGVAHLTLGNRDWLLEELRNLERGGIKAAMVAPAPVHGRPLAHPDLDPVWRAFVEHDVALVFHVGGFRKPFDPAWYELDPEPVDKVLDSTLLWVPAAVAIHNLSVHGALERHPALRIGVIELTSHWVAEFLMMQEGALGFYVLRHGEPPTPLPLRPSEYFLRQVKVCSMAYEVPLLAAEYARNEAFGEVLERVYMAGSDWPHAEGIAHPREGFEQAVEDLPEAARRTLLTDNARWLLNL